MKLNPYTPGAGVMPGYLSGREKVIEEAKTNIFHLINGYPQRPIIYYGLRGVGKTVLLNKIEEYAFLSDILYCHIEVKEKTDLILELINESNIFLQELSNIEKIKSMLNKLKEAIDNLSITYTGGDNSLTINANKEFKNVVLSNNITKLFTTLGMLAKESNKAVIFFIDEIQYTKKEQLEALKSMHLSEEYDSLLEHFILIGTEFKQNQKIEYLGINHNSISTDFWEDKKDLNKSWLIFKEDCLNIKIDDSKRKIIDEHNKAVIKLFKIKKDLIKANYEIDIKPIDFEYLVDKISIEIEAIKLRRDFLIKSK